MMLLLITLAIGGLVDSSVIYYRGSEISFDSLVVLLKGPDVVFIGEKHDDPFAHHWELGILKNLHSQGKYVLCMEMFERDVQGVLDKYLKGKINEDDFLKNSRPWPNYKTDYRPMIEYAKENKIPVCASNIPRREAALISKGGKAALDSLTRYSPFAKVHVFTDDSLYKKRFFETMSALRHSRMKRAAMMKENFFLAQCLKDAVMAGSIIEWLDRGYKVFHVNGSFHSDYHSGIVYQLREQRPGLKILTIKVLPQGMEMDKDMADVVIRKK